MRTRLILATVAGLLAVLVSASPAAAVGETVGGCAAEALAHLEEEGISLVAIEEAAAAGDKEAKEELEEIEEALEDCIEAPSPILPEVNEIIWGGLAFVLLLAFMMWKGFPAVKNILDRREQTIANDLDAAERAKIEAQEVKARYEAELADARSEAGRILEEARQQADTVRTDLQARAEADIAEMRAQAAAEIEAARGRAMADLQSEVADIVVGAAEQVVQAELDHTAHQRLIENYINQVGSR